jgi:hypothetical protein
MIDCVRVNIQENNFMVLAVIELKRLVSAVSFIDLSAKPYV